MTRSPSEAPVSIETKWHREYRHNGRTEWDEVTYILTFADGSSEEVHDFRNEWNPIFTATSKAKLAAATAKLDATLADPKFARVAA